MIRISNASTAPAKVQIWISRSGQGNPLCILCIPPRNADTILSLEVHSEVAHKVIIASKKPQAHPEKSELNSQEKVNKSDPALAKILLNPALIPLASSRPRSEPSTPDKLAITTPSMTANARASDLVTPIALNTPSSLRRDSASIRTMVSTNNTPAAMVNVPNTKNIPEITPEDWVAALAASTFTAVSWRLRSSLSDRSLNHNVRFNIAESVTATLLEFNPPPARISIDRSSSPDAESCSP